VVMAPHPVGVPVQLLSHEQPDSVSHAVTSPWVEQAVAVPPHASNWPTFPRKHPGWDVHESRLMESHRVAVPVQMPPALLHPNTEPQLVVPA
jgi:hypothetical protein